MNLYTVLVRMNDYAPIIYRTHKERRDALQLAGQLLKHWDEVLISHEPSGSGSGAGKSSSPARPERP